MKKLLFILSLIICANVQAQVYPCVMNAQGQFTISTNPMIGNPSTTLFAQTSNSLYRNSTTETVAYGAGVGSDSIAANYLVAGKILRITFAGIDTMPAITAGTVTVKVKYGSTVLASGTTSVTGLAGANGTSFTGQVRIICQTGGASGSAAIDGAFNYSVGNNLAKNSLDLNNAGLPITGIDFTSKKRLVVTFTWDAATTTRSISTTDYILEALN